MLAEFPKVEKLTLKNLKTGERKNLKILILYAEFLIFIYKFPILHA